VTGKKWGQTLGNIIALVTLLTAAGAVYSLRFRHEPARREPAADRSRPAGSVLTP
jgi:hypothetical protein